jgi:tetratricopeptide (TPR) repeat protein
MKTLYRQTMAIAFLTFFCTSLAMAEEKHPPAASGAEKLGQVHFPISCGAETQIQFDRAVALLHSFWYDEAGKAFTALTESEPGCAMGYWGVAMSLYHPLWAPPSPTELEKGRAAVQKALLAKTQSDHEKDYIAAIAAFYKDSDKLDHRTRALAYEKAMEQVYLRYPKDSEAAVFYALSLNGTALPTDKTYANQKKAAEILNKVLAQKPDHPGVAHYTIHSYDSPPLASLALPAARSYAKIAPSAPHALHMPSHIFTRLGLWEESIQSNLGSAAAAKDRISKAQPGAGSFEQLHAMDYLVYAYLQGAQDKKAKQILDEIGSMEKVDAENFAAAYALAAIPARYALERRSWPEAAALTVHPATFPWDRFRYAEAITHFARALGGARKGDLATAQQALEKLASIQKALVEAKDSYWADQVEIQRRAAAAWLAQAEGKKEEALNLMRSAADLEDTTEKHPVTPGSIRPAHELLAELLLEQGDPSQALREFEASLRAAPNRLNALYGAAQAALKSGDRVKAKTYYTQLVALSAHADTERREIQEANLFLAKK